MIVAKKAELKISKFKDDKEYIKNIDIVSNDIFESFSMSDFHEIQHKILKMHKDDGMLSELNISNNVLGLALANASSLYIADFIDNNADKLATVSPLLSLFHDGTAGLLYKNSEVVIYLVNCENEKLSKTDKIEYQTLREFLIVLSLADDLSYSNADNFIDNNAIDKVVDFYHSLGFSWGNDEEELKNAMALILSDIIDKAKEENSSDKELH